MIRQLGAALVAAGALAATANVAWAGTSTFGLVPYSKCGYAWWGCGKCAGCPQPFNAFSPHCCGVENASGCTMCPFHPSYLAHPGPYGWGGGFGPCCGPTCGYGAGWYGPAPKQGLFGWFHKGVGGPYCTPLPPPCGAIAAFHGVPGSLGCGDPYAGCGSKRSFWYRWKDCKGEDTDGIVLEGAGWGKGFFGRWKEKWAQKSMGGGYVGVVDGMIESSPLIHDVGPMEVASVEQPPLTAPCTNCGPSAVPVGPAPLTLPAPGAAYAPHSAPTAAAPASPFPAPAASSPVLAPPQGGFTSHAPASLPDPASPLLPAPGSTAITPPGPTALPAPAYPMSPTSPMAPAPLPTSPGKALPAAPSLPGAPGEPSLPPVKQTGYYPQQGYGYYPQTGYGFAPYGYDYTRMGYGYGYYPGYYSGYAPMYHSAPWNYYPAYGYPRGY